MLATLDEFARAGFAPFARDWAALDALARRARARRAGDGSVEGEACGTDADGALLLRVDGGCSVSIPATSA